MMTLAELDSTGALDGERRPVARFRYSFVPGIPSRSKSAPMRVPPAPPYIYSQDELRRIFDAIDAYYRGNGHSADAGPQAGSGGRAVRRNGPGALTLTEEDIHALFGAG